MKYYFLLKEAHKIESLTFGSGQHPYSPDESLQQVLPSGHDAVPPGHTTFLKLVETAGVFTSQFVIVLAPTH